MSWWWGLRTGGCRWSKWCVGLVCSLCGFAVDGSAKDRSECFRKQNRNLLHQRKEAACFSSTVLSQREQPHFRTKRKALVYTRPGELWGQWNWMFWCLKRIGWQQLSLSVDRRDLWIDEGWARAVEKLEPEIGLRWRLSRRIRRLSLWRFCRFRCWSRYHRRLVEGSLQVPEQDMMTIRRVDTHAVSGSWRYE